MMLTSTPWSGASAGDASSGRTAVLSEVFTSMGAKLVVLRGFQNLRALLIFVCINVYI